MEGEFIRVRALTSEVTQLNPNSEVRTTEDTERAQEADPRAEHFRSANRQPQPRLFRVFLVIRGCDFGNQAQGTLCRIGVNRPFFRVVNCAGLLLVWPIS